MNQTYNTSINRRLLVVGTGKLACSVAVCLAQAQESVTLLTDSIPDSKKCIKTHIRDINQMTDWEKGRNIDVISSWKEIEDIFLAVVINEDILSSKEKTIKKLESLFPENLIIAISTNHIPLGQLQERALRPEDIVIMNWAEPAHTTFFLELVHNEITNEKHILWLKDQAKSSWKKDPYVIKNELGIRFRMIAAMIREAFYLVQNGYASIEDIDRACRNDAGTYMPFAGNFRYMDLMGTYAYSAVMKELNKELSTEKSLPDFFLEIVNNEKWGMKSGEGLYPYEAENIERWRNEARNFSYEIRDIMERYPFGDK